MIFQVGHGLLQPFNSLVVLLAVGLPFWLDLFLKWWELLFDLGQKWWPKLVKSGLNLLELGWLPPVKFWYFLFELVTRCDFLGQRIWNRVDLRVTWLKLACCCSRCELMGVHMLLKTTRTEGFARRQLWTDADVSDEFCWMIGTGKSINRGGTGLVGGEIVGGNFRA